MHQYYFSIIITILYTHTYLLHISFLEYYCSIIIIALFVVVTYCIREMLLGPQPWRCYSMAFLRIINKCTRRFGYRIDLTHSFKMDSVKLSFERTHGSEFKGRPEVGRDDERDDDTILAWQEDCCTTLNTTNKGLLMLEGESGDFASGLSQNVILQYPRCQMHRKPPTGIDH